MNRQWTDLPFDLLSKIADMLGLIDLLSFRGVCRDWQTASSWASARIELQNRPWFLTYRDTASQCTLLSNNGRIFTLNIPEMHNSICLASYVGWLLLFRENSLFFFCPFSRSKIFLPSSPFSDLSGHIAAFSSPPTSSHCVVAVIKSVSNFELQLFLLRKGSTEWMEHRFPTGQEFVGLQEAAFCEGVFHVLDGSNGLITYDDESEEWERFVLVPPRNASKSNTTMLSSGTYDELFKKQDMKTKLRLENNVSVSVCPAILASSGFRCKRGVMIKSENVPAVDEGSEIRHLKGTWIQPIYYQASPDHKWL